MTGMRHSDRYRALFWGIFVAVVPALARAPAYAISFHFSPATISVEAAPGQTVSRTLSLTLAKECAPTHFKARMEDWWRNEGNDRTFYAQAGTIAHSCGKWCSVNPVESAVKPDETMTVKVTVHVPGDAKPGGYWSALTIDEVPDPTEPRPTGVSMIFRASLSVAIYVEIPTATRAARISGVRIADGRASVTLVNEGNIPLRVNGTFEFRKPGEETPVITIPVGGEPILPEPINTCTFSAALPDSAKLPDGRYKVRVIVDAGLDHVLGAERELDILRPPNR